MAIDMRVLKARGCSSGSYKRIFSGDAANYTPRVKKLVDLIANRARNGRTINLEEWRAYAAIDIAYDVPFQQTTPTLVQKLLSQDLNFDQTKQALAGWGLNEAELYLKIDLPGEKIGYVLNPPVFFKIFIPLVQAYVTIRLAKLFNERNLPTLLEYNPLKETSRNQVLCEIITDLVQTISNWYGYPAVLRQCIQQMLKYGVVLTFPYEEWDCQEQVIFNEDNKEETVTVKEGLRYHIPHPTRMYYDLQYPLTTLNSDTGVRYAGHWTVQTYGEVLDNPMYWNRRAIFSGTNWFDYGSGSDYYFQEFFPCKMASGFSTRFGGGRSGVPLTREDKSAFYNNSDRDQAVFLTEHFEKLIPSQWGLGEYDKDGKLVKTYNKPVWHRFTLAGDDTVLWAEPVAYCPSWFMGYHYDQQAGRTPSLALQAIPFQDHVGNILSQTLLTAKQNLANVTFYDTNLVDKGDIEKLQNMGERMYRGMNFIGYDSLLNQKAGLNQNASFSATQLAKQSITEHLQLIPLVLNIMERVLQISAQEVGSAASHQQSKAEIVQTGSASTNGVVFTGSFVDEGMAAWKQQLYDASQAYMDSAISAQVSSDIPDLEQHLGELGFEVKGRGKDVVLVSGHKRALRLEGFANTSENGEPGREKEIAQVVFSVVGTVAGQPELFKKVGAKNLLALLEEAAKFAGAGRDFRLTMPQKPDDGGEDDEVPENVQKAIEQAQQAIMQAVTEKIAKPVAAEVAQDQQKLTQLEQVVKQLEGIFKIAGAEQEKAKTLAAKTQADQQRKDFQAQKTERRKDAALQAELARKQTAVDADIALKAQKSGGDSAIAQAEARHEAALREQAAAAEPKSET